MFGLYIAGAILSLLEILAGLAIERKRSIRIYAFTLNVFWLALLVWGVLHS